MCLASLDLGAAASNFLGTRCIFLWVLTFPRRMDGTGVGLRLTNQRQSTYPGLGMSPEESGESAGRDLGTVCRTYGTRGCVIRDRCLYSGSIVTEYDSRCTCLRLLFHGQM